MDQGCSVLDCFFFLRPLISCLLTHPPILSFFFILSGLPQEDWPRTPSSPSLPPHPRPPWALCSFFSCAVLLFLCFPGRKSSYYLYFILPGCLIPSPHPQPPNIPEQFKAGKLSIASRGRLSLCENPQVASLAGFP